MKIRRQSAKISQKKVAEARSALEAHKETDVELTFLELAFGGKSSQSKIAAHEAKTEALKKAVQKCKDMISDIDYDVKYPHGYSDAETRRRNTLKAAGRADYDKAHPDEVREREMLEELYEKCRIGYVPNPISQPTGHKHDIERRVMKIEGIRGLTEDETIAKHKGVSNVVEIIEKYRCREIDRGRGR